MQVTRLAILLFGCAIATNSAFSQSDVPSNSPGTRNYDASGNLQATYTLDCIPLADVKPIFTPADLFPALAKCVEAARYEEATDLFIVAGSFANFDTQRVADRTAHQGIGVLIRRAAASVDPNKWDKWAKIYKSEGDNPGVKIKNSCDAIRRLGPPNYYPSYMIQHGMKAVLHGMDAMRPEGSKQSGSSPLVEPFDPKAAWEKAVGGPCDRFSQR